MLLRTCPEVAMLLIGDDVEIYRFEPGEYPGSVSSR